MAFPRSYIYHIFPIKKKRNQNCNLPALLWTSKKGNKKLCIISASFPLPRIFKLPFQIMQNAPHLLSSRHKAEVTSSLTHLLKVEQQWKEIDDLLIS